jgi:hypothetical protein
MTTKQIDALIEAFHRATVIPTGVGGQQVGCGTAIVRLRMTDTEISDLHDLLRDVKAIIKERNRLRLDIRESAICVDPKCPDIDAYVDGHCGLPRVVYDVVKERDELRDVLANIQTFGKNNPGCGFSCAKLASKGLEGKELNND